MEDQWRSGEGRFAVIGGGMIGKRRDLIRREDLAREQRSRVETYRAEVERLFEGRSNCDTLTHGGCRIPEPVRNRNTGETYASVKAAAQLTGLSPAMIRRAVKDGIKAGGARWEYV